MLTVKLWDPWPVKTGNPNSEVERREEEPGGTPVPAQHNSEGQQGRGSHVTVLQLKYQKDVTELSGICIISGLTG